MNLARTVHGVRDWFVDRPARGIAAVLLLGVALMAASSLSSGRPSSEEDLGPVLSKPVNPAPAASSTSTTMKPVTLSGTDRCSDLDSAPAEEVEWFVGRSLTRIRRVDDPEAAAPSSVLIHRMIGDVFEACEAQVDVELAEVIAGLYMLDDRYHP